MYTAITEHTLGEPYHVTILPGRASMRLIKSALGLTGSRVVMLEHVGNSKEYRLVGTSYQFSVEIVYES